MPTSTNPDTTSTLVLPPPALPIPQLESLKFKANQIIDSILALQRTIEGGNMAAMPAWPDILSKYNMLLSQTHSFSVALVGGLGPSAGIGVGSGFGGRHRYGVSGGGAGRAGGNVYERIVLHPSVGMTDAQLDGEVIPLLRNQQTTDVLRMENETVRRLAEHMATRGSVGVLGGVSGDGRNGNGNGYGGGGGGRAGRGKVEYEDVLRECEEIKSAHDRRMERAVRAVTMLRERFEWKQRVEVEVEEPEELEWDPRIGAREIGQTTDAGAGVGEGRGDDRKGEDEGEGEGEGDVGMDSAGSSDEDEVEGALVDSAMDTQSPTSANAQHSLAGLLPASITVMTSGFE